MLNFALSIWNDKLGEVWNLLTISPQAFKGGTIWSVIQTIHGTLQATGLAQLFHISQDQMNYISNADAGCGLIRYGSTLVPFEHHFPKDTELYRLMTTKPGEAT